MIDFARVAAALLRHPGPREDAYRIVARTSRATWGRLAPDEVARVVTSVRRNTTTAADVLSELAPRLRSGDVRWTPDGCYLETPTAVW